MDAPQVPTDRGQAYLRTVTDRLVADGCQVRTEDWGGDPVLIGSRADFRLQWMATRLHLFTVVATAPGITAATVETFADQVAHYVKRGKALGMQTGVAVFPVLISPYVEEAALSWAAAKQRLQFAVSIRPVVVDTSRGVVAAFRGNSIVGRVYSAHLRRKLDAYFPPLPPTAEPPR